jgi:hypothetical protein
MVLDGFLLSTQDPLKMRALVFTLFLSATAWAADRDISMREGETRSFKLAGVAQLAVDDVSVVEGAAKNDQLSITARHAGLARIMVLLKNDQWLTFKVKVVAGDLAEGPVPEALPAEGVPVRLRVGESRAFETPGVQKMPMAASQNYEAKVNGKILELKGVLPGRALADVTLTGGKRLQLPVLVEGVVAGSGVSLKRGETGEKLEIPLSGEVLLKADGLESVQVDDDEVAEVRIIGESRVVVRGLQEGETIVNVRRGGRVYSHAVNVTSPDF